jgi:hypothetical protein
LPAQSLPDKPTKSSVYPEGGHHVLRPAAASIPLEANNQRLDITSKKCTIAPDKTDSRER